MEDRVMKHGRTFAELALVAAAALLIAACSQGPGDPPDPLPTWSPPSWMHGTWTVSSGVAGDQTTPVTGTVEVSARNLVANFQAGGTPLELDLAKRAEQGMASIKHHGGESDGKRYFGLLITPNAGGNADLFNCAEVDSATMVCTWTAGPPPNTDQIEIGSVRLTKQPG